MVDEHYLLGGSDLDSPDTVIPSGFHREARNLIFRGPRGKTRAESFPGTTEIVNPLLPAGTNKTINSTYDPVNHQIIFFNYNSNGDHGIYLYTTSTGIFQIIIQVGINTDGDILGFTLDKLITSVNIEYRDIADGNILYYVDTIDRPTCLNIQRYINPIPAYTPIKRAYIDLAKAPPVMPPQVGYENDATSTVNNLLNALFQFKERFVFDDFQKSVLSTGSRVPLPTQPFDQIHDSDPTKNSRIAIYLQTGDADVKKIEVWGQKFYDGLQSDYFLITTLDKDQLNIPDNDAYRFVFKNDGVYLPAPVAVTGQLQDVVPQKTNAMELLNGNVPVLGGITEGYDLIVPGMNVTNVTQVIPPSEISGLLFFASQGGVNSGGSGTLLKITVTGCGINGGSGFPQSVPDIFGDLFISATDINGTDISFSTPDVAVGPVVSVILNNLRVAALLQGFTFVSLVNNDLVLSYSAGFILNSSYLVRTIFFVGQDQVSFAYADQAVEQFGLQYFDDKGRTNGTSLPVVSSCKTLLDVTGNTVNKITINITSRPPVWAKYYDLVRLNKPTYNKRTFWVSNQTFTNVDLNTGIKYAYIGIGYMIEYDKNIQAATPVVSYEFTPGDRIKFQVRYNNDQTPNNMTADLDFEIVSVDVNPFLNGVAQQGSFIKIIYPTAAITAGFDFGAYNFQWYKILIYNYRKNVQDSAQETFFEFSRRYGIGNSGTVNAFHLGETQSQNAALSQPAVIFTMDGDYFRRLRSVPVGAIYYPVTSSIRYSDRYANIPVTIPGGPVVNAQYELRDVAFTSSNTNLQNHGSPNYLFWNKQGTPVTIHIKGEYTVVAEEALTHQLLFKLSQPSSDDYFYAVKNRALPLTSVQSTGYTLQFDAFILVPPDTKVFIVSYNQSVTAVSTLNVGAFTNFYFAINANILIPIIEDSYSDNYNIVTNSNSRPTVYDENAKQKYESGMYRWGLADQFNTNINQANNFLPQNFDIVDTSYGAIVRFRSRKRELRIFQERRCGRTGIYARFLQSNTGDPNVVTTDSIITSNNISYYEGEFGIGNQSASLCSAGFADYFIDPVKGFALRLSGNGIEPISEQNKAQTWAGGLTKYLNNYVYQYGGNAAILGVIFFCNDRPSETWFLAQGGTGASNNTPDESFIFREEGNLWTSFLDFAPDSIVCAENKLIGFKNGKMYSHENTNTYCNYYGNQFKPSITLVKNDNPLVGKSWQAISQVANVPWISQLIYTNSLSYAGQRQESKLFADYFKMQEEKFNSVLFNDIHSNGGIGNGDYLKGSLLVVKLEPVDGSKFAYLSSAPIRYSVSSRYNK